MQTQETMKQVNTTAYATFSVANFKNELATLKTQLVACVVDPVAIEKGVQKLLAEDKAFLDDQVIELKRNVAEATARLQELEATAPNYHFWMHKVAEIQQIAAHQVSRVESELQPGALLFEKKKAAMYAEHERRATELKAAMLQVWDKFEADCDDEGSEIGRKLSAYSTAKDPGDKEKAYGELIAAIWAPFDAMFRMVRRETKLLGIETPFMRFEGGVEQQAMVAEQGWEGKVMAMMAAKL